MTGGRWVGLAVSAGTWVWTVVSLVEGGAAADRALLWAPLAVLTLALWVPPACHRPAQRVMKVGVALLVAGLAAAGVGYVTSIGAFEPYGLFFGLMIAAALMTLGALLVLGAGIALVVRPGPATRAPLEA